MKPLVLCALLAGIASLASAQAPTPKLQVLIVTGQNIPAHDWRVNTPVLRKLLEDSGRFEVRVAEEFRGAGPETLAPYDVVVLNYYDNRKPELRWGERTDAAFLNYVRSGRARDLPLLHGRLRGLDGIRKDVRRQLAAQPRAPLRAPQFQRGYQRQGAPHHARNESFLSPVER